MSWACTSWATPSSRATFIQQEALWVSESSMFSGAWWMQTFIALSHLGAKGQPSGRFRRSIGVPVIGVSLWPMVPVVGIERRRPLVYSCLGS